MNADTLSMDLARQVQDAIRLRGLGGGKPMQLEFRTLMGQHCLRVSIGVKGLPYGPLDYGYEPRVYGFDEQEELRQAAIQALTEQGLKYAGHREISGRAMSWLEYLRPSMLL